MRLESALKWGSLTLVGGLLLGSIAGAVYQSSAEAAELEAHPPPGEFLEVQGTRLHLWCQGRGSPTVVVEQGLTRDSGDWTDIHAAVAEKTRICGYDRPGLGYSEPTEGSVRSNAVAARLHDLLDLGGVEDDIVLVGWSAGGVYIREYYRQFPERVRGMVFVDSSHEQQGDRLPKLPNDGVPTHLRLFGSTAARLGLLRATGFFDSWVSKVPEAQRASRLASFNRAARAAAMLAEVDAFALDNSSTDPPSTLEDLPLTVLSQGEEVKLPKGAEPPLTLEFMLETRGVWNTLQLELTALSTRGKRIVATNAGHGIHADDPQLLIAEILAMVEVVRGEGDG